MSTKKTKRTSPGSSIACVACRAGCCASANKPGRGFALFAPFALLDDMRRAVSIVRPGHRIAARMAEAERGARATQAGRTRSPARRGRRRPPHRRTAQWPRCRPQWPRAKGALGTPCRRGWTGRTEKESKRPESAAPSAGQECG